MDKGSGNGGGATGIKLFGGTGGAGANGTMRLELLLVEVAVELFLIVTTAGGAN